MSSNHPTLEELAVLLGSTSLLASKARNAQVIRHLLSDCVTCRDLLRNVGWDHHRLERLHEPGAPAEGGVKKGTNEDYSRAFALAEQAVSAFLDPEPRRQESVAEVLAELGALPASEQVQRVSAGCADIGPAAIEALIRRSHATRYQDADEMLHLAHLARLAADACSPDGPYGELRVADLRARAYAQYGNALRVSGQPREAEDALMLAQRHRRAGTGDPMLRAWLLLKIVPLAIFHGRFEDAIEKCEEAGEVYRELDEHHLLASTLIQKAIAVLYSGDAESAIRVLNRAIPLIDHEEDPQLLLAACHNLIHCYIDLGRPDQALLLFSETRGLLRELDEPLILLRADWQEGLLLRDLGHLREAEVALSGARKGYLERKLAYEVALVSLDLATVYVRLGLVEELKRTVMTTVPIFHSLHVGLETLAALLQLQQVAGKEQQTLELIRTLSTCIEPLRRQRMEEG